MPPSNLSQEWGRPDLMLLYDSSERLHINFYEDTLELDDIATRVGNAKALLRELETLRLLPPRPPAIVTRGQRNRWRRLTGELLPLEPEAGG